MSTLKKSNSGSNSYQRFDKISGKHSIQQCEIDFHIPYKTFVREKSKVRFFNFQLAREMGLISQNHPNELNEELVEKLIQTFSLQIINEYDYQNQTSLLNKETKDHYYMATRYLQLQHPDKKGLNSGDGRSIWNGEYRYQGKSWDISSCGTGATQLSPACSLNEKFYQTGDPTISYGCGYAEVDEGLSTAFFSDVLRKQGVPTERCLLVLEFPNNLAINVRVHENLLRPSHFFRYLKQKRYDELKKLVDYYIDKEVANGRWQKPKKSERYEYFLEKVMVNFAHISALFESEYIFCWLDWDGDNVLVDGSIIDYGSIRQFGLFHAEYRYDDVQRYSTSILEQKAKAKYIVQTFIQCIDYIQNKKLKAINRFSKHSLLKKFDKTFERKRREFLLQKLGLSKKQVTFLMDKHLKLVKNFQKNFYYFERAKSVRGIVETADGITQDAIFCMRDLLRELPQFYLMGNERMKPAQFIEVLKSNYATYDDLKMTSYRRKKINDYQKEYRQIVQEVSKYEGKEIESLWLEINMRSSLINRYEKVTGDSITQIVDYVMKNRSKLTPEMIFTLIEDFSETHTATVLEGDKKKLVNKHMQKVYDIVHQYREGI